MPGENHFLDITRVIQLAVAPVFLLTAIATIINVLVSRLARAVDRRRVLEEHLLEHEGDWALQATRELEMLDRRVALVIWAVALAVLAALMVCLLIGIAFVGAFVSTDLSRAVAILFVASVGALTVCLLIFLREISIAAVSARQTVSPVGRRTKAAG